MYIIRPAEDGDQSVKYHMVQSEELMQEVLFDLETRFGPMTVELDDTRNRFSWDPGGMQFGNERFDLDLNGITISCLAQHFDLLRTYTSSYTPRGRSGVEYVKIHSRFCCLCISPAQYTKLLSYFEDDGLVKRAKEVWQKAEAALNDLAANNVIIRAVQGSDGKIYSAGPSNEPIDPKDLN